MPEKKIETLDTDEEQPQIDPKAMQEMQSHETNKKIAKVAAKGAVNYFTAGKGGKIVDIAANTAIGSAVLDTGANVLGKAAKIVPGSQNLLNKANDTGAIDVADKAMDSIGGAPGAGATTGAAAGAANTGTKAASNGVNKSGFANKAGSASDSANKTSKGSSNNDLTKLVSKKNIFLMPLIGSGVFFFLLLFLLIIGPNAGATLDVTSGSQTANTNNFSNTSLSYTIEQIENMLVYVGDSRTVGLQTAINKSGINYIAETGAGYNWFLNTGKSQLETILNSSTNKFVIFAFGVNDLSNIDLYINLYTTLISTHTDTKFYFMSVNPVDETLEASHGYSVKNADIGTFNQKIATSFGNNYIDTYSEIVDNLGTSDGVHYTNETYTKIHEVVVKYLQDNNKFSSLETLSYYPSRTESVELIDVSLQDAIGSEGIVALNDYIDAYVAQSGKCTGAGVAAAAIGLIYGLHQDGYHLPYYYGGGHGANNGVNPVWGSNIGASLQKPSGNYDYYSGLDCSGFVSWCINEAGVSGVYTATGYIPLGTEVTYDNATSGDVLINSDHILLILENKNDYLQTAESTSGGVQFSTKTNAQITNGNYGIYNLSNYYSSNCTQQEI